MNWLKQKTTLAIANNNKLLKNGLIDEKQHAKNLSELQTRLANYNTELDRNIQLQRQQSFDASMGALQKQITMATPVGGTGLAAGFMGDAGAKYEEAIKEGRSQDEAARFAELQNQLTLLETRNGAVKSSVLAPVFHWYWYGVVPPLTVLLMDPPLTPKHVLLVTTLLIVMAL